MGEVCPPTAADYAAHSASMAEAGVKNNAERIKALELQVQELRQFSIMLIMNLRNPSEGINHESCDRWWARLGSYPEVENDH